MRKRLKPIEGGVLVSPVRADNGGQQADTHDTQTREMKSEPSFSPQSPQQQTSEAQARLLLLCCSHSWKSRKSLLQSVKMIDVASFSSECEQMFLELARAGSGLAVREIIAAAAYHLDISPETAKRYLSKHSAIGAELSLVGGKVVWNAD
jgi:hypothetical protein